MINVNNHSLSNLRRALVFFSISFTSPRDSTFNRTTGSVLEERRLKRQSAKVMLMPSVRSTASASRLKCCSTRLIASTGCASLLLISPLAGNAASGRAPFRPAFFLSGTPVRRPAATGSCRCRSKQNHGSNGGRSFRHRRWRLPCASVL